MAEPTQYLFSHREVAELLVKQQDIHEGIWALVVEFSFGLGALRPEQSGDYNPTAVIAVTKLGIGKANAANNLTVDAAQVNPKRSKVKKKARAST